MIRYLSYRYEKKVPVYGRCDTELDLKQIKNRSAGDSCNTFWFGMENHWGTHVDAPAHFFDNGLRICNYPPDYLFFDNPQLLDLEVEKGELIGIETLNGKINKSADILLLKTGFHKFRGDEKYRLYAPGIKAEVGFWLREEYGNIRAIGFDFISLSSFQNREEGRASHKAFLDPDAKGNPILIVEDMNLCDDLNGINKVIVAPLLIEGIDSAPCIVMGILE